MAKWPNRRRECLYYLAVGYYRLGEYRCAMQEIDELLSMEPHNQQAQSLRKLVEAKASRGLQKITPAIYNNFI